MAKHKHVDLKTQLKELEYELIRMQGMIEENPEDNNPIFMEDLNQKLTQRAKLLDKLHGKNETTTTE